MNEFLTLICDVMEHMKIGGFTKLRELEPELKRQYDGLDQQSQWDCLGGVAEAIKQNRKFQMLLFSYLLSALRDEKVEYFIENLLIEESTPLLSRINTIRVPVVSLGDSRPMLCRLSRSQVCPRYGSLPFS